MESKPPIQVRGGVGTFDIPGYFIYIAHKDHPTYWKQTASMSGISFIYDTTGSAFFLPKRPSAYAHDRAAHQLADAMKMVDNELDVEATKAIITRLRSGSYRTQPRWTIKRKE